MKSAIIVTSTGTYVDLLDPIPEDIRIEDIAHGLSLTNRFNGQTSRPYSVALHSIYCATIVSERHVFQALMHDAPEAYLGDVVTPLKRVLPEFCAIEDRLWHVICEAYGVDPVLHEEVRWADRAAYAKERYLLMPHSSPKDDPDAKELADIDRPRRDLLNMTPGEARATFMKWFREYRPRS